MDALNILHTKRNNHRPHTREELEWWIQEYSKGNIPEYQMSAWLMAVCWRGMTAKETAILTKCIDLENEIRGLFKIFGIKLPPRLGHGAFDGTVRDTIEADEALAHALLPLLDARLGLYRTFEVTYSVFVVVAHVDYFKLLTIVKPLVELFS